MILPLLRTLVKVIIASLVVGTILAHFGITADQIMHEAGLSSDRIEELARRAMAWALPNVLLGALVIVPIWLLFYIFRPPGHSSSE
jgi:acetyl-CoA acetyltransferase